MAWLPENLGSTGPDSSVAALIARLAKAVVHFDALACEFPASFGKGRCRALKPLAERIKLLSESLRLSILMERTSVETAEASAALLMAMRQLHLLGTKSRLHPSHQMTLRLALGLVEQIVQCLRDLRPTR